MGRSGDRPQSSQSVETRQPSNGGDRVRFDDKVDAWKFRNPVMVSRRCPDGVDVISRVQVHAGLAFAHSHLSELSLNGVALAFSGDTQIASSPATFIVRLWRFLDVGRCPNHANDPCLGPLRFAMFCWFRFRQQQTDRRLLEKKRRCRGDSYAFISPSHARVLGSRSLNRFPGQPPVEAD